MTIGLAHRDATTEVTTVPSPNDPKQGSDPRLARHHNGKSFLATQRKLIMPEDLNAANRLFGGRLMEWIDEAAALYCMVELDTKSIVTKKISEVIFNAPANLGDVLEFIFRVKHAGRSSIVIEARARAIPIGSSEPIRNIVECDLVFVTLDEHGRPKPHGYVLGGESQDQ